MAAKHTPGPWLAIEPGHIRTQSLQLVAVAQHGINAKADARLIAAAPDLLAALVALEAMAERYRPSGYTLPDAQKLARAAIAKATGAAL